VREREREREYEFLSLKLGIALPELKRVVPALAKAGLYL
jgi:hypothetical protein